MKIGEGAGVVFPVPSWPEALLPRHQRARRPVVMPHSCEPPTSTILLSGMSDPSGAAKVSVVGLVVPLPQHLTPEPLVAQVRPEPASMSMEPAAPVTNVGACFDTVDPMPSWPVALEPQQYVRLLADRMAQLCVAPVATSFQSLAVPMRFGADFETSELMPSCPLVFTPQQ